jgi:hypothetical protein
MAEWCIAHPWMTFLLAALAIYSIDCQIANLFRVILASRKAK